VRVPARRTWVGFVLSSLSLPRMRSTVEVLASLTWQKVVLAAGN